MRIRIGTRGSRLALLQTRRVVEKMKAVVPNLKEELKVIKTSGDLRRTKISSGMFVNEINQAVLKGEIDIGIHSLKDLPTKLPRGLSLACVPERLTPNDAFISRDGADLHSLPKGSVLGTSSPRRRAEIAHLRPDLKFEDIRGNIETRIEKMERGLCDGIIVALAALQRLGLQKRVVQLFEPDEIVPAVGQGALAVVCKEGKTRDFLRKINNRHAWREVMCERAFLTELGLGCKACVGAVAQAKGKNIELIAVAHEGGRRLLKLKGPDPIELGKKAGVMMRQAKST